MTPTILVVEDEPAIQELIAANLSRAGHHVVRVADAESAEKVVKEALPDLVLLDPFFLAGILVTPAQVLKDCS